jgi:hypothetical protein
MKKIVITIVLVLLQKILLAQIDTIIPAQQKLLTAKLSSYSANYVVYWEDENGQVLGAIDIWKRELKVNPKTYAFNWKWYRSDTLYANISTLGNSLTMEPLLHEADYFNKGKHTFQFRNNTVSIPDSLQITEKLKSFKVNLNPASFAFPMDLEILALLPFQKVTQKFAIPFYEPGSKQATFYHATITAKEKLPTPGGSFVSCWVIRLDYAPNSYAEFWIAQKERQVIKMREFYQGKHRYKVKLY